HNARCRATACHLPEAMLLRLFLSVFSALLFVSTPALADTVWLTNGDRLTGQVRLFDGGTLLLETDFGGVLRVNTKSISTLETRARMVVRHHRWRGRKQYAQIRPADPGRITLITNGESFTLPLADIYQIMPQKQFLEDWIWRGNIDFSLDIQRGDTDLDDHDVSVLTDFLHQNWRHNLRG